jgi:hypothetical protein
MLCDFSVFGIVDCGISLTSSPLFPSHLTNLRSSMSEMTKGTPRTAIGSNDNSREKQMSKSAVKQENSIVANTQKERKRSFGSTAIERDEQRQDRATVQIDDNKQPASPPSSPKRASLSGEPLADDEHAKAFDWMGEGRFHLTGQPNAETQRDFSPTIYHDFKHRNSPTSQVRL